MGVSGLCYKLTFEVEPWQARFKEDLGYVVVFTHYKAVIWRYAHGESSESFRTLTIKFPSTSPKLKEPLPLGVLVHDTGAGELALLMVQSGGKVTYWEAVANAANTDLMRQKHQGLHGTVHGLLSGELVHDVAEAESDGFILTTNFGRVIHLSVRDSQGKPTIYTEVLRGNNAGNTGVFGSIRSVLSIAGWRKDIAATRCSPYKGKTHRKCIVATKQGAITVWDLVRHSSKTLEYELDAKNSLREAVMEVSKSYVGGEFQILDFTFFPSEHGQKPENKHHLLFLVGMRAEQTMQYSLIELTLQDEAVKVNSVFPITCWDSPLEEQKSWLAMKTRILLPEPAHTAYILLDDCYVIISLTQADETPDLQLQRESDALSEPFQDVLFFAEGREFHIVGCANDSGHQDPGGASCLLLVNDFGLIHTSSRKVQEGEASEAQNGELSESIRASMCVSKIEQAIFFGDDPSRLFDFHRAMDVRDWQTKEVEGAALRISESILTNKSTFVNPVGLSVEQQLKDRANALKLLIKFISRWDLSLVTRWELLWNAEKLAAARAWWQVYTQQLALSEELCIRKKEGVRLILLKETMETLSELYKSPYHPKTDDEESDVVRHYLTHDVSRIEHAFVWLGIIFKQFHSSFASLPSAQAVLISQANDSLIVGFEAAFAFREQNAELYGIPHELVEDGIFRGNYQDIPDVWTSRLQGIAAARELTLLAQETALTFSNAESPDEDENSLDFGTMTKLAQDSARLASLTCKLFEESYLILQEKSIEQLSQEHAQAWRAESQTQRRVMLSRMVDLELPEEGLKLAEKYSDIGALAEITHRSIEILNDRVDEAATQAEKVELDTRLAHYEAKRDTYFINFGLKFADVYYAESMSRSGVMSTLKQNGPFLPEFLHESPGLAKATWIFNACSALEYGQATRDLLKINSTEESLWNKKVEVSLAKLSILAAEERKQTDQDSVFAITRSANRRLTAIDLQNRVHQYTRPVLRTAIDQIAEVDLAMESYGAFVKKKSVLAENLRQYFDKLIRHRALDEDALIDLLTLISCPPDVLDEVDLGAERFSFSFLLVQNLDRDDEDGKMLHRRVIWRRCILQDDWTAITNTQYKDDAAVMAEAEDTAMFKTLLHGFRIGIFLLFSLSRIH